MTDDIFALALPDGSSVFLKDAGGNPCVTADGLDAIWPRDENTIPLQVWGKGVNLPDNCNEALTEADMLAFAFNGPDLAPVPLPAALPMLIAGIAALMILKRRMG